MMNGCNTNGDIIRTYIIDDVPGLSGCTLSIDQIISCSSSGITILDDVYINGTISSLIFSGGTFYGDGSQLSGISTDNFYVTGGTFDDNTKTLTLFRNDGNSVLITGFTDYYVTGGTYSNGTLTLDRQNGSLTITGFTTTFTGNTSGDCITDLFVSNVNSCSPLHVQPTSAGDVYIGENGGVNVGIGTSSPSEKLEISGKTKTETLQVTSGATNGYILTSDSNGNAIWSSPSSLTGLSTTDYYVTGGTYSNGTLTLERQDSSFTISGFLTGTTTDTYVTGFTYLNNNLTISQNEGQPDLVVNIDVMSGLTINGNLIVTGNTIVQGLTATTISGGTYYGDGSNLTNIVTSITSTSGLSGNSITGNVTIINTSPDQVVTLSGGTGVSVTGTYPNFTIINTSLQLQTNTINLFNYYNFI